MVLIFSLCKNKNSDFQYKYLRENEAILDRFVSKKKLGVKISLLCPFKVIVSICYCAAYFVNKQINSNIAVVVILFQETGVFGEWNRIREHGISPRGGRRPF